jgi:O-antigen ligase
MTGVLMIALALLFSQSRSGMASVLVASALMLVVSSYLWRGKRRSYKASRIAMTIVAVAAGMVMAAIVGVDAVLLRFFDAPQSLEEGRLPIWGATIRMFLDSPILGHGWGSFPHLVSGYRPAPDGLAYSHAHNEYLEILDDGGLVAIAIVGLMLALFARRLFSALASPLPGNRRRLIVGLAIAITSVLLHSVTDFGLRVPAVCLMFVAVVAIFVTLTEQAPGGATT